MHIRILNRLGLDIELADLRAGFGAIDRRAAFALAYTAVILTLHEYFFSFTALSQYEWLGEEELRVGLAWVAVRFVFFLVIPAIIVRVGHRQLLSSIGWSSRGLLRHLPLYLLLYLLVLPLVIYASRQDDFTRIYPFVTEARTDLRVFLLWQCAYALSFLALEAFFRGYLLFTCAARMGWLSIFVMVVPYAMIHFHKPWPEALGAIVAGAVLGGLALALRSFSGGVVVHVLVAATMDTLAVRRAGLF